MYLNRLIERCRSILLPGFESKGGIIFWLMVVMASFALNSIITRYLVLSNIIHPFTLTTIRFIGGFLMLQIIVSLTPDRFPLVRDKRKIRYFWGAVLLGIYAFSISYGYAFISAAAGVLIFFAFVVLTMTLFSVVVEKKKINFRIIFGQILGLVGVLGITISGLESVTLLGSFLMALTGIAWGLYSVHSRKFRLPFTYTYNTFFLFAGISLMMIPFGYFSIGSDLWENISPVGLGLALYLGMISTALAYVLWHKAMKRIHAFQGGIAQLTVPVLTAFMGVLFLGEEINIFLVLGGILILSGIALNTFYKRTPFLDKRKL